MSLRQRICLGITATAVQLAGCLVLLRFRGSISWLLVLAGFYLSSWLALAVAEIVVGAPRDRRKSGAAVLTAAGVVGSYAAIDYSLRTGQPFPAVLFLCVALCINLIGSLLLGWTRGRAGPAANTGAPGQTRRSRWLRGAALLVAASASAFVGWQATVASVSLTYAVEPRLIGDLRTLISAQAAYATSNFGFYDSLECLQAPSRCIPDYSAAAPVFLESKPWSGKVGYFRRRFVPGPAVDPKERAAGASPSSIKAFAYVAVPAEPEGIRGFIWRRAGLSLQGVRSFCADSTGRICVSDGGTEPRVADGICAPECKYLQ